MKQIKRILCIAFLLFIILGSMISTYATNYAFFAYDDDGVYRALKLENSISPYFYYYNTANIRNGVYTDPNGYTTSYTYLVSTALNAWNTSSFSALGSYETSTIGDTHVNFWEMSLDSYGSAVVGLTRYTCLYQGDTNSPERDWAYANVYVDADNLDLYCSTYQVAASVFMHEFGHALGLDEYNTAPYSIMCQLAAGRTALSPATTDFTAVQNLYN